MEKVIKEMICIFWIEFVGLPFFAGKNHVLDRDVNLAGGRTKSHDTFWLMQSISKFWIFKNDLINKINLRILKEKRPFVIQLSFWSTFSSFIFHWGKWEMGVFSGESWISRFQRKNKANTMHSLLSSVFKKSIKILTTKNHKKTSKS